MTTWQQFQNGVGHAWDSLVDGWLQLYHRASGAITKFIPGSDKKSQSEHEVRDLVHRSVRWGILPAELFDERKKIVVRLEAPGLDADEIELQVRDKLLVVHGEKRQQRERAEGNYQILECAYGSFERSIPLPAEVDASKAKADYKRGVLQVELPKVKDSKSTTIKVRVA